jgi:hypothetical protein
METRTRNERYGRTRYRISYKGNACLKAQTVSGVAHMYTLVRVIHNYRKMFPTSANG